MVVTIILTYNIPIGIEICTTDFIFSRDVSKYSEYSLDFVV